MNRKAFWMLGLALAALIVGGATGCHWEGKLGLGTVTGESKLSIDEWAQANFLKAVDDLIAKIPDPNKKDGDDEETATDGTGDVDGVDGG